MAVSKPYPGTQSVIRAITLLKAFTDDRSEWKLADLAREVGLNKTTAFRLLTALESEQLVARSPESETYRLGPEAITLGGRALRANDLRSASRPRLASLAAQTGETASLEILSGPEVLILDEVIGKHVMSGAQSIGTRWPAHSTSTGKAILAELPAEALSAFLPDCLPAFTSMTLNSIEALRADLARIRRRGYAIADEELEIGLVAVGAALRNYDGEVVGAISVAGSKLRLTAERIAELGALTGDTARLISEQLGYRPKEPRDSRRSS